MILNIILGMLEMATILYVTYYFMSRIGRTIYRKKRYYITAFTVYGLVLIFLRLIPNSILQALCMCGVVVCMGYFLFNPKLSYQFYYLLLVAVQIMSQWAVIFGLNMYFTFMPPENQWTVYNVSIAVKILVVASVVMGLTFFIRRRKLGTVTRMQVLGMLILPSISIFLILVILEVSSIFVQLYGSGLIAVSLGLLLFLNFYFINLSVYTSRTNELDQELKLYQQQSEIQFHYYEKLEKRYQESRKVLHDMKNHLQAVERLYNEQELEAGNEYVKDMHHMLNIMGEKYYTGHKMLNIILNDKLHSVKEDKFEASVQIGDVDLSFMKDIDVTTIFANLLDNAVEAVTNLSPPASMQIKVDYFNEFIVITVRNGISKEEQLENTQFPHKKRVGHQGFGLQNVKKTLEKYNGSMQIVTGEDEFQVNITLPKSTLDGGNSSKPHCSDNVSI